MKPARSVVLAFYPDVSGGPEALRSLKRQRLRRSTAVQCFENGSVQLFGNRLAHRRQAILGGAAMVGLFAAVALLPLFPPRSSVIQWIGDAMFVAIGIVILLGLVSGTLYIAWRLLSARFGN